MILVQQCADVDAAVLGARFAVDRVGAGRVFGLAISLQSAINKHATCYDDNPPWINRVRSRRCLSTHYVIEWRHRGRPSRDLRPRQCSTKKYL